MEIKPSFQKIIPSLVHVLGEKKKLLYDENIRISNEIEKPDFAES